MNISENNFLPASVAYVFDRLDEFNIFFWLDAGTLLKGVRDKTILKSSDIDIAVFGNQIDQVLQAISGIEENGYKVKYNDGYSMLEDLITIYLPESINRINSIDIYIYNQCENNFIRRSYHKPIKKSKSRYLFYLSKKIICIGNFNNMKYMNVWTVCSVKRLYFLIGKAFFYLYELIGKTLWYIVPKQYFSEFVVLQMHSRNFNIPKQFEEYLCYRYGDDWEIPLSRTEWLPIWSKEENNMLVSKKLSDFTSIKKYWMNDCV